MAAFNVAPIVKTNGSLATANNKVGVAGNAAFQSIHAMTITPEWDERVEVSQVQDGIAADTGAGSPTLTMGVSFQQAGQAEEADISDGSIAFSPLSGAYTSSAWQTETYNPSPAYVGGRGKAVTARTKVKSNNAAVTTTMGGGAGVVTGRVIKDPPGAFKGAF